MDARRVGRLRPLGLALAVGLAGSIVGLAGGVKPAAAAVPAPPAGFSLTWSDDFTGAANTGVNTANWQ